MAILNLTIDKWSTFERAFATWFAIERNKFFIGA